jgi:hypothetical protein
MKFDSLESVLLGEQAWATELTMDELAFVGGGYGGGYGSGGVTTFQLVDYYDAAGKQHISGLSVTQKADGTTSCVASEYSNGTVVATTTFTVNPNSVYGSQLCNPLQCKADVLTAVAKAISDNNEAPTKKTDVGWGIITAGWTALVTAPQAWTNSPSCQTASAGCTTNASTYSAANTGSSTATYGSGGYGS